MQSEDSKNRKNNIHVALIRAAVGLIIAVPGLYFFFAGADPNPECTFIKEEIDRTELELERVEHRLKQGIQNDTLEAIQLSGRSYLIDLKTKYQDLKCE